MASNNNLSECVCVYKSRNIFLQFGYWIAGKGTAYAIKISDSQLDHNYKLHIGQKVLKEHSVTIDDIESLDGKKTYKAVLAAFKEQKINDLVDMLSGFRDALIAHILYEMLATEDDIACTVAGKILSNMGHSKIYNIIESMFGKSKSCNDESKEKNQFFGDIITMLDVDQAVKLLTGIFIFMPGMSCYGYDNDNNNNVSKIVIDVLCALLENDKDEKCDKVESIIMNMINQGYDNDIGGLHLVAAKILFGMQNEETSKKILQEIENTNSEAAKMIQAEVEKLKKQAEAKAKESKGNDQQELQNTD